MLNSKELTKLTWGAILAGVIVQAIFLLILGGLFALAWNTLVPLVWFLPTISIAQGLAIVVIFWSVSRAIRG